MVAHAELEQIARHRIGLACIRADPGQPNLHRRAAVPQRIADQIAHQQPPARRIERQLAGHRIEVEAQRLLGRTRSLGRLDRGQLDQQRQIGRRRLERGMAAGQALALEQIGDQLAHLAQIAQQRLARGAVLDQLGMQARAGQRRAQLMADRQQQRALGLEHAVQRGGHGVDLDRQPPQLAAVAHRDRRGEVALAVAHRAGANVVERPQPVAHHQIGQQRQAEQRGQRDPADRARPFPPGHIAQAEADAVAVRRDPADQQPAALAALVRVGAVLQRRIGHPAQVAPARGRRIAVTMAMQIDIGGMPGRPHAPGPLRLTAQMRVRVPLHHRPVDAHRQRQARHQRLRTCDVRRRTQVRRQPVGIVGDQRAHQAAPASADRALQARHEHRRHRQRQHHEQQQQARPEPAAQPAQHARQPPHSGAPAAKV